MKPIIIVARSIEVPDQYNIGLVGSEEKGRFANPARVIAQLARKARGSHYHYHHPLRAWQASLLSLMNYNHFHSAENSSPGVQPNGLR